ncbi:MAG: Rieske 2Fe-2S domain-containing protein [Proteobacteria bacterium]|nr:Rieske 2Fe-2S domain-containing protein [Pseudomonadota bacterium]MBU1740072.1 Rieske 2Fe-2S domain-containing protein [Pseudomonadota bacterium]
MGLVGFFKSVFGICNTPRLPTEYWRRDGEKVFFRLSDAPELKGPDGAVYPAGAGLEAPVLVVNAGDQGFVAFRDKCAHMGRKLDPVAGQSQIRCCSLGKSTYDLSGEKVSGPAKGPITDYPVEFRDGELFITVSA